MNFIVDLVVNIREISVNLMIDLAVNNGKYWLVMVNSLPRGPRPLVWLLLAPFTKHNVLCDRLSRDFAVAQLGSWTEREG